VGDDDVPDMSFLPDGNEPRAGSPLMNGMNPCACTVFHE
jgi:hypothetical protein